MYGQWGTTPTWCDFQNCIKQNFKCVLSLWNQNETFTIYKTCFIAFRKKELMLLHSIYICRLINKWYQIPYLSPMLNFWNVQKIYLTFFLSVSWNISCFFFFIIKVKSWFIPTNHYLTRSSRLGLRMETRSQRSAQPEQYNRETTLEAENNVSLCLLFLIIW